MSVSSSARRRLFVAAELPEPVRAHLAAAVEHARGAGTKVDSAVRWTDPASWHLTVVFCGAVSSDHQTRLARRLRRVAAQHPPLRLGVAGGGQFGNRVLWAGVAGATPALVALAGSASEAARLAGIAVEERPYRPHLTIARGRPGADLGPGAAALADYSGPTWLVEHLVLVESSLGAGAGGSARHATLEAYPLG